MIYVTHGSDATGALTASTLIYDRGADAWFTGASASVARSGLTGVCIEDASGRGRVFAVGGTNAGGPTAAVEIYDPVFNSWSAGASMPTARTGMGAALVPGFGIAGGSRGTVYVFGGTGAGGLLLNTNEAYDVELDQWVAASPMPIPMTGIAATVFSPDTGMVFAFNSVAAFIYDPQADISAPAAPMPTPRQDMIAGVCGATIYTIGGSGAGGNVATNENYNPFTNTWSPAPAKPSADARLASQSISSGLEIYAIGGTGTAPSTANEVFTCGAGIFCPSDQFCVDLDSCTSDSCDPGTNTCRHVSIAPGGVGDTLAATHNRPSGVTTLSWTGINCQVIYNTYRGTIPSRLLGSRGAVPYDHTCFESDDAAANGPTVSTDAGAPAVGTAFYYLATSENAAGEMPLGTRTGGGIPNISPCPTPPP